VYECRENKAVHCWKNFQAQMSSTSENGAEREKSNKSYAFHEARDEACLIFS